MQIFLWTVLILLSVVLSCITVWYQDGYVHETKPKIQEALKAHKVMLIVVMLCYFAAVVIGMLLQSRTGIQYSTMIQNLLLWDGVLCAAIIDFQVKKIPNKLLLVLFALRCGFLLWEIFYLKSNLRSTILLSLVGMALGGGIIGLCKIIERGSIGAGDLKLFGVLGFYFGAIGIIQIMIFSLFFSAIFCIGLLIFKKAKSNASVPMAPFILIGLSIFLILS